MGKSCNYQGCTNYWAKIKAGGNPEGICFVPFPKPKTNAAKCRRWIAACRPDEDINTFMDKITKNTYICSKHFVGKNGPTTDNPDPIAVPQFQVQQNGNCLQDIVTPVGWTSEKFEDGTFLFAKKRKQIEILKFRVSKDLTYTITILDKPSPLSVLLSMPKVQSANDIAKLLNYLNEIEVCNGNTEAHLVEEFMKIQKPVKGKLCVMSKSVFSSGCKLICPKNHIRCVKCRGYRSGLKHLCHRGHNKSKHLKYMTRQQLIAKIKLSQAKEKVFERKLAKLGTIMQSLP